jgi:hypothetical protein
VNILPTNQTLILAGEFGVPAVMPRAVVGQPRAAPGQALAATGQALAATGQALAAPGQALKSVTLVTAGHESLVYLRADYSSPGNSAAAGDGLYAGGAFPARPVSARNAVLAQVQAATPSAVTTRSGWSGVARHAGPLARYAQNQQQSALEPLMQHVDVYA